MVNTIQTSVTLRRIQDCIHSVRSDRTDNHLVPIQIFVPIGLCLFLNLACLGLANQAKLFLYHSFSAGTYYLCQMAKGKFSNHCVWSCIVYKYITMIDDILFKLISKLFFRLIAITRLPIS